MDAYAFSEAKSAGFQGNMDTAERADECILKLVKLFNK